MNTHFAMQIAGPTEMNALTPDAPKLCLAVEALQISFDELDSNVYSRDADNILSVPKPSQRLIGS